MEIKTNLANIILEAKSNEDKILDIIKIMNPLIKMYVNKLFFLEKEDAEQEILEAIIIAIHEIHECNNSGQAFVYLQNAIKFRYCALCKSNITMQLTEEKVLSLQEPQDSFQENYSDIDFMIDFHHHFRDKSNIKRKVLKLISMGYTDTEIAQILGKSRQYINRIKKTLM